MYIGADYYPEHWVYPYDGTAEAPESRWERDAEMMVNAGLNVVRMGEFSWGLCEPEEEKFNFDWLRRAMDIMGRHGIKVVLGTPTAAPPLWLSRKHPEILPLDERGLPRHEGTRRAYCLNSDVYWDYSQKIVRAMAGALGKHPQVIAWQIDNGIGRNHTEYSFNPETRRDWHNWLKAKYETVENLNNLMGLRFWGQTVTDFAHVPMPMVTPAVHNPALVLDWRRFSSDTCVAYVKMQADLLREFTPQIPVTTSLRAWACNFDYFDMAEVVDFVSADSDATIQTKSAEIACSIDFLRSLKKTNVRTPDGEDGFWVIEQKAGNVSWQAINSLVRPGVVRMFTYQLLSRGATGALYFFWRQPRIGPEKFYGGVLTHDGRGDNRMYGEISQVGQEVKRMAEALTGTKTVADTCILVSFPNDWALQQPMQPNRHFSQREHIHLFHTALHDRNIAVDFAQPSEDLSKYKVVFAPSLHLLSGGETDRLKLYVQNGGVLVSTFNTGLVDEHHITPLEGYPFNMTDLFGLSVKEFDPLPEGEENHLVFKGTSFHTTHHHAARLWCDLIEPKECQVVATFSKDFYAGRPAITINKYGSGQAIYVGTMSHQSFYYDLVTWVRQMVPVHQLLKVPDTVEVGLREKEGVKIYFLINHQNSQVRLNFFKPMHDLLSDKTFTGSYDLPAHGVLVLDERLPNHSAPT